MDTKKMVLKLYLYEDGDKKKAMKTVCSVQGLESLAMDMKEKKLTVIGKVDPVTVVKKLRKLCRTDVLTVGPAKDPEKKKGEGKKGGEDKQIEEFLKARAAYYTHLRPYYYVQSTEENPNACCVIC